jgi:hypothetical protein
MTAFVTKRACALTVAAVLGLTPTAPAADSVVDFPKAVMDLDDVPEDVYSGILVVISGGFSPFVEKRWFAWTDGAGGAYKLEATLSVVGEVDVHIRSTNVLFYEEFETELLDLGAFRLTTPETAGTGAPYVTDLPTYHVYLKTVDGRNSFSVRNPAAAGEEYSHLIEALLDYFEGE